MKKAIKIIGIVLGILIVILLVSPFLFKGSLEKILKRTINENLNATVAWESLDLSLFRSFPQASLRLNNFSVINKSPFEGDTLASGKTLKLEMGIMQLFKSKDLKVDVVKLDQALVNIKIDALGNANYNVALKEEAPIKPDEPDQKDSFTFELKHYEIENSRINYLDETSHIYVVLTEVDHTGKGDLSQDLSNLDTETRALASLRIDSTEYLTKNKVSLKAIFELDLKNRKYTFLENEAKINDLPLTFDGYVQINEKNNEVDIHFKTPSSDFINFLAVIPETYVKQINNVKTTGNFTVNGEIKGIVDSLHIPTMDIKVTSENASFKYPDLPKAVDNITIDAELINKTGFLKDTYLNIPKLTFRIDGEPFQMKGSVKNMTENPWVNMEMQGTLNLANIKQVLPVEMEQNLSGIFKADLKANFDMESVNREQYQKIDARGTASLTHFNYDAGFKKDLKISNANLLMQPGIITLKELNANTGQTDIKASGNIQNLISFLTSKQQLKGRFTMKSNTFNVNDFTVEETNSSEKGKTTQKNSTAQAIKIPDFLDATLDFSANTVIYDNLELKNAKGIATIQNETITIDHFTSDIFGGTVALSGDVSTKSEVPTFSMNLDLSKIDIDQSFEKLEMFQYLVPIAKALQGSLNTKFQLNGKLTQDLSPILSSLGGKALAEIITAEVNPQQAPLLSALGEKVSFLNLDKLSLRDVTANFNFNKGEIEVKPFHFDIKGIDVTVAGSHGLDKTLDYNLSLDVPAKYLGDEVAKLLQNLNPKEVDELNVILPIGLKGTFSNPHISVNTEKAVNQLTQELIAKQKDKLVDKGTGLLEGLLEGKTKKDTTKINNNTGDNNQQQNTQQQTTEKIKGIFEGLMGGKKKKNDTVKTP